MATLSIMRKKCQNFLFFIIQTRLGLQPNFSGWFCSQKFLIFNTHKEFLVSDVISLMLLYKASGMCCIHIIITINQESKDLTQKDKSNLLLFNHFFFLVRQIEVGLPSLLLIWFKKKMILSIHNAIPNIYVFLFSFIIIE